MSDPQTALFLGFGSPHGDDQIGWRVADGLTERENLSSSCMIRKATLPLDLFDWLDGLRYLWLCDAAQTNSPAGSLARWEWRADHEGLSSFQEFLPELKQFRFGGSHDFRLVSVLDLATRLNRLPPQVVVLTISGKDFSPGADLSQSLKEQLPILCHQIAAEIRHA